MCILKSSLTEKDLEINRLQAKIEKLLGAIMILLVFELVLVLLLTGSGEAGEPTTDVWIVDGQWHGDPSLTTCPEGQACIVDRTKTYTCYQRMKEAMRAMDYYLGLAILPRIREGQTFRDKLEFASPYEMQAWNQTMHDCVKETP